MITRRVAFVCLWILALSPAAFLQSQSNRPAASFTGLDVVILIDQSGSMWGYTNTPHPAKNDQYEHRIGQTKNILYRLAEHVENTPFVHRVSVIDFGDSASVAIAKHEMRYDPSDPGAALRITKSVADRNITAKTWVNTNTPAAMQLGLKEFQGMAALSPNSGRKPVLLLITDGRPNLPGKKTDQELRQEIQGYSKDLRDQGIGLWIVGLNDGSNYWNEGDGIFWEGMTTPGRSRLALTTSNVFTMVQEIVDEWLDTKSRPIPGDQYECPPYLRRIAFNVNFATPRSPITISDPDGNAIPLSAGGASSSPGTTARFQVEDPKPGTYRITKDPTRSYRVSAEEFSPIIKRLSPAGTANVDSETRVLFQVTDSMGTPLTMMPGWPITASVVVTAPSGSRGAPIPASFEGDGKFQIKWKPTELGTYKVKLQGIITLKDGSAYDVFNASAYAYDDRINVNRLNPYRLRLDDPDPTGTLRLWPGKKSASIQLSLVDKNGQKVTSLAGLVNDPATWLSLQLIDSSGVPLSPPAAPLVPDATGTFTAVVPVRFDVIKGEGWWSAKQINFRVVAQSDRLTGDNFLDSLQLPPEADSKRVGSDPLTVGPIDAKYALMVLLAIWLVLVLILLFGLWLGFMRLLPGMLIWRADSSRRRTVELKIYNGDDDPNGDFAKKYPAGAWERFKYDQKIILSVDGQECVAKKFRVRRLLSPDQVLAQVQYSWQNDPDKKEYTVLLRKGKAERLRGLPSGEYLLSLDTT